MKTREYTQNILLSDVDNNLPKVLTFLDALESESSRRIYRIGLAHGETFLKSKGQSLETVIEPLLSNELDRYIMMQQLINYLKAYIRPNGKKLSPISIRTYLEGIKSYLGNYKIYFIAQEYKARVRPPKIYQENNEDLALDKTEVRDILLKCSNPRLKAFLMVLASGGTRAKETLNIKWKDIEYNNPTKINLQANATKTAQGRYFFISNEATRILQDWKKFKYRRRDKEKDNITFQDTHYVFTIFDDRNTSLEDIYKVLQNEFSELLSSLKMDARKEGMDRRKITFHSLRAFAYSTISDIDSQFGDWMLGHSNSTYWRKKADVKRLKYLQCMKHLTYLDFELSDTTAKTNEGKIEGLEAENQMLRDTLSELKQEFSSVKPWMVNMEKRYNEMLASGKVKPLLYKKRKVGKEFLDVLNDAKHDVISDITVLEAEG